MRLGHTKVFVLLRWIHIIFFALVGLSQVAIEKQGKPSNTLDILKQEMFNMVLIQLSTNQLEMSMMRHFWMETLNAQTSQAAQICASRSAQARAAT